MEKNEDKLLKNTILRNEYYSAGRTLLFSQNSKMAGIMLGYAIELSLKILLDNIGKLNGKLINSHNINDLFEICKNQYPKLDVISEDLIKFVNDRLDQRYNSGAERVGKYHLEELRVQDFPLDIIHYYDKLFYELDKLCWISTNKNKNASSLYRTLITLNTYPSRAIFHCNYALDSKIDELNSLLLDESDAEILSNFINEKADLWDFNFMFITLVSKKENININLKDYKYQMWEEKGNGVLFTEIKIYYNWRTR